MTENKPMSESLQVGIVLALAGGILDAYTFLCRGGVFATAETGNLVLLGLSLARGDLERTVYYLFPILAFAVGVLAAEGLRYHLTSRTRLHWSQWMLILECAVLILVAFIPDSKNSIAIVMVSFVSAVQVETFRKFRGHSCMTTMCTGNLRSATELVFGSIIGHRDSGVWIYYAIIGAFVVGAVVSGYMSSFLGIKTVLIACIPLMFAFALMFLNKDKSNG